MNNVLKLLLEGEPLDTEWVMLTSGTTGTPKMVVHSRAGLVGAIDPAASAPVWGTFYDIRRYGGLQIFLRAVLGGSSLVLSEAGEAVGLVVAWDAGVSWNPARLDDEGDTGEHGEYLLKEVAEFGVLAEAFTESVDTDKAVRKDDTKAGRGSLRGS